MGRLHQKKTSYGISCGVLVEVVSTSTEWKRGGRAVTLACEQGPHAESEIDPVCGWFEGFLAGCGVALVLVI
jgi:hypothetical protein